MIPMCILCRLRMNRLGWVNCMRNYTELNPTQRVAYITFGIMAGQVYTSAEIARIFGISRQSAWLMMTKLSAILPIYQNDDNQWVKVDYLPDI